MNKEQYKEYIKQRLYESLPRKGGRVLLMHDLEKDPSRESDVDTHKIILTPEEEEQMKQDAKTFRGAKSLTPDSEGIMRQGLPGVSSE